MIKLVFILGSILAMGVLGIAIWAYKTYPDSKGTLSLITLAPIIAFLIYIVAMFGGLE